MNRPTSRRRALLGFAILGFLSGSPVLAADKEPVPNPAVDVSTLVRNLSARPIGPATMGGRVVDVAVVESRPATFYVATASGGLWKTVNNGTTWKPVFEDQPTISIGDVAVAPSDPNIVWVGTGEANARNSVSWGDGVYKSIDGGQSWTHMGLRDSHHIGRVVIHPKDPNVVYVAALGHFWGPNRDRGLLKTTDGGKTWTNTKYLSDDCGFVDMAMDPDDPDTLYAAAYQVRRDGFSAGNPALQFGEHAGIYKTSDGGDTWVRLTKGLPTRPMGRIGLDIYRRNSKVVYAVIQTDKTAGQTVGGQPAKADSDPETGGVFRSDDHGETWTKVNSLCPRPFYYGQIRIDPSDDQRIYVLGVPLHVSSDGGKTFRADGAPRIHVDHHALWINPRDSEHLILGCDGGINLSYDRGATWEFLNNLPIGQFYAIGVDMRKPYWVYGGLQDNGSWGGPSATRNLAGISNFDWVKVNGADGFYCQVDPTDPKTVYAEGQYGNLARIDLGTGETRLIRPRGLLPTVPALRWNWCSPVLISPHNPRTIYYGGNHLYRSLDRGDRWQVISPDLTRGAPGTITVIAESPVTPGLLWVGTDDGKIHVSRNGGNTWTDLSEKVPDVPQARTISRIECSFFDAATAYLTIDRHRNDDYRPYVFKTTDHGETWKPLAGNLPENGPVLVIRASKKNKDLLFVGTEFGPFISLDGGSHWEPLGKRLATDKKDGAPGRLPTVAVHDLVIHPRDDELVIATHGRSIYIMDIAPLLQVTPELLAAEAHLFDPKPAQVFRQQSPHGSLGPKPYFAPNPQFGATIWYHLRAKLETPVKITVTDPLGNLIQEMTGPQEPGLHAVNWGLRRRTTGPGFRGSPTLVAPGDYLVKLTAGATTVTKKIRVEEPQER